MMAAAGRPPISARRPHAAGYVLPPEISVAIDSLSIPRPPPDLASRVPTVPAAHAAMRSWIPLRHPPPPRHGRPRRPRVPLPEVAGMVRAAIAGVTTATRFQELVDWMEERKAAFRDDGKWTETVNLGLGSPALFMFGLLQFAIDRDLGFGKTSLVLPWVRHGRLGSASVTVVPCPNGDGSWFFGGTRMWSRLMEVVESDPLMKPTANPRMVTPAGSRL
jgi:hypothetical protein